MGNKQIVISELLALCHNNSNMVFDNQQVKQVCARIGFGNPFDVTKVDHSALLPGDVRQQDYFVVHLGEGLHRFVKGISFGYHRFEPIAGDEVFSWKYRQSILNDFDASESNILSVASNQRILHDFLYNDIVASPKVYNARRTKTNIEYMIGNSQIVTTNLQMEIDLTLELNGVVTVVEGKNGFPEDFAVYQLFHPYKYYRQLQKDNNLPLQQVNCCYILREKQQTESVLRLYLYIFDDENRLDSIRLLKKAEYRLVKR